LRTVGRVSSSFGGSGQGFWLDIALGIVGAIVGGLVFSEVFGMEGITGLNLWSFLVAIAGSVVVLFVYHALMGRRQRG
jgi:uncharacterized membrane protein YeaQ/YmgE (transglycosylase-associated protein family)